MLRIYYESEHLKTNRISHSSQVAFPDGTNGVALATWNGSLLLNLRPFECGCDRLWSVGFIISLYTDCWVTGSDNILPVHKCLAMGASQLASDWPGPVENETAVNEFPKDRKWYVKIETNDGNTAARGQRIQSRAQLVERKRRNICIYIWQTMRTSYGSIRCVKLNAYIRATCMWLTLAVYAAACINVLHYLYKTWNG